MNECFARADGRISSGEDLSQKRRLRDWVARRAAQEARQALGVQQVEATVGSLEAVGHRSPCSAKHAWLLKRIVEMTSSVIS